MPPSDAPRELIDDLPEDLSDPLPLARALIRCRSVTPADDGAMAVLRAVLERLGFACHDLPFGEGEERVRNLFARRGEGGPHLCFAGHVDVVPPGEGWRHDPFAGTVEDGVLYGRGAVDMKGGVAAFVAACDATPGGQTRGSLSLLITGVAATAEAAPTTKAIVVHTPSCSEVIVSAWPGSSSP